MTKRWCFIISYLLMTLLPLQTMAASSSSSCDMMKCLAARHMDCCAHTVHTPLNNSSDNHATTVCDIGVCTVMGALVLLPTTQSLPLIDYARQQIPFIVPHYSFFLPDNPQRPPRINS